MAETETKTETEAETDIQNVISFYGKIKTIFTTARLISSILLPNHSFMQNIISIYYNLRNVFLM